jgi:hypothetical protein
MGSKVTYLRCRVEYTYEMYNSIKTGLKELKRITETYEGVTDVKLVKETKAETQSRMSDGFTECECIACVRFREGNIN